VSYALKTNAPVRSRTSRLAKGIIVSDVVMIDDRFCGPPNSGNGGYACGRLAGVVGGEDVEVTLHAPPPLNVALAVVSDGAEARLFDGERVIASAKRTGVPVAVPAGAPEPLDMVELDAVVGSFDVARYETTHAFATCFTCGPGRLAGDGLRIFPAPLPHPGHYAWSWAPDPEFFDSTGAMDKAILWAALDCPSGQAWLSVDPEIGTIVLGKMAVTITRLPTPNEALQVLSWTGNAEGRRRPAGSAIYGTRGDLIGVSSATWVALTDEQAASFAADGR
jgi:hypothetical protein